MLRNNRTPPPSAPTPPAPQEQVQDTNDTIEDAVIVEDDVPPMPGPPATLRSTQADFRAFNQQHNLVQGPRQDEVVEQAEADTSDGGMNATLAQDQREAERPQIGLHPAEQEALSAEQELTQQAETPWQQTKEELLKNTNETLEKHVPAPRPTTSALAFTNDREDLMSWGRVLATSGKYPNITTPEAAVATILLARDLKLPEMVALTQMHVIEGKPTLGLNLIMYLLDVNGVVLTVEEDYGYYENPSTGQPDYLTRITFRDKVKYPEGASYSLWMSECATAGWTQKANWKKMPRLMLRSRCITAAARLYYPKFLGGVYETQEMVDAGKADADTYAIEE